MAPRTTRNSSGSGSPTSAHTSPTKKSTSEKSRAGSVQLKDTLKNQSNRKTRSQASPTSNVSLKDVELIVGLSASSKARAQRVVDAMATPRSPKQAVHFIEHDTDDNEPTVSGMGSGKRVSNAPSEEPGQKRTRHNIRQPLSPYPTTASDAQLVNEIRSAPRALEVKQMADLFRHLKTEMRKFCEDFFTFELDENQSTAWPLHLLKTDYEPLKRVTQYIADGSQHTWRTFFTSVDHRPHLVYGILGEFFKQHIFAATAFGMSTKEIEELEKLDRTYMYYDAFVRAKHRANLLEQQLDAKAIIHESHDLQLAVAQFAEDLFYVLEPLLPTFMIAEDSPMAASENASLESKLRLGLEDLTRFAARIHQSIRLTGKNGTVVRFCQPSKKGEQLNELGPQNPVNQTYLDETHRMTDSDKPIIKMTCFSRVEAYQPFGPDQLELEEVYSTAVQDLREATEATKVPSGNGIDRQSLDLNSLDFQWPVLPAQLQGRHSLREDSDDEISPRETASERGSYVVLTQVTPSDVYLEWSRRSQNEADGDKQIQVSLDQAVEEARRQRYLHHWDRICTVADISRPYAEWVALVVVIAWVTGHKVTDLKIPRPSAESIVATLNGLLEKASNINRGNTLKLVNKLPETLAALKNNTSSTTDGFLKYSGGFLGLKDRNITSPIAELANLTSSGSVAQAATDLGKRLISQNNILSNVISSVLVGSSAGSSTAPESAATSASKSKTASASPTDIDPQTSSWLDGVLKHFFSVRDHEPANTKQSWLKSLTRPTAANDDNAPSRWSRATDIITALRGERSEAGQATNAADEGWSWSRLRFPRTTVETSEIKVTKGISFGSKDNSNGEPRRRVLDSSDLVRS